MTYYIIIVVTLFLGYYIYLLFFMNKSKSSALDQVKEEEILYEFTQPTVVSEEIIFNSPTTTGGSLPMKKAFVPHGEKAATPLSPSSDNTSMKEEQVGTNLTDRFHKSTPVKAKAGVEYLTVYDIDLKTAILDGAAMFSKVAV